MNTNEHTAANRVGRAVDIVGLPNGDWVIADDQRFWLQRPQAFGPDPFVESLEEPGNREQTRQLFAGVFAAAGRQARQSESASLMPPASLLRHIHGLASSYQTAHATPPIMRMVAERFRAIGRAKVAEYCEQVAREESGHDELALRDLAALGINALAFVAQLRPARAMVVVDYFQQLATSADPISVLGYAYALERTSLFQTGERVAAIEAVIPAGIMATRCLRVHSAVGTDMRHVEESLTFIAELPAADRRCIVLALYQTLVRMQGADDYPGDAAVEEMVRLHSVLRPRIATAIHRAT
ncbi:MAG: hypothetical protein RJA34_2807 [Pseudomonadota bacterium]|jgi:hypothetical protein